MKKAFEENSVHFSVAQILDLPLELNSMVLSGTFFQTINQLEGGARSTAIFINLLFSVFIGPLLSITCAVGNFLALANLLGNLWVCLQITNVFLRFL